MNLAGVRRSQLGHHQESDWLRWASCRFRYDNSIVGFYGFGPDTVGMDRVASPGQETGFSAFRLNNEAPCTDPNQYGERLGSTPKFSLSYKITPDHMLYATFSKGYRPGGPSRNVSVPPFTPDYLTNYELPWKTSWLDHHLIFNGEGSITNSGRTSSSVMGRSVRASA